MKPTESLPHCVSAITAKAHAASEDAAQTEINASIGAAPVQAAVESGSFANQIAERANVVTGAVIAYAQTSIQAAAESEDAAQTEIEASIGGSPVMDAVRANTQAARTSDKAQAIINRAVESYANSHKKSR